MLSLIKIELNKVSKSKLFFAWLGTILIILGITGIIIMGLGTDNKLGEFIGQNTKNLELLITGKVGQLQHHCLHLYLPKQHF